MARSRSWSVAIALLTTSAAVFCLWSGVTAQTADLPFHAKGAWRSNAAGDGSWQAQLALNGNTLTGILSDPSRAEIDGGLINGSVAENSLTVTVSKLGTQVASFSGSLSGTSLVGSYSTPSGDTGMWAGGWRSNPPVIARTWPAGTVVLPYVPVPDAPAQLSGVLLAPPPALGGQSRLDGSAAAPTISTNVRVSVAGQSYQNEPEVAIHRHNSQYVAAGANDQTGHADYQAGFYASTNGGTTWPYKDVIPGLTAYNAGGDPVLDFGPDGFLYYAGVAFDRPRCPSGTGKNAVFVSTSYDAGRTYQNAVLVASSTNAQNLTNDKPWLAAAPGVAGRVYLTWTKVTSNCTNSRVWEAVSTNWGANFDAGRVVSDDSDSTASSVAVGTDGVVNIVWLKNGNKIMLDRCTAGGTTCGADRLVANITPLPSTIAGFKVNSFPTLAIDNASGGSGYMAIVWADKRSGNADIYFTLSSDNGNTWLTPKAIASTPTDEFFPTITIDDSHLQRVSYYRRVDSSTTSFNLFFITSGNGQGNFTAPVMVNDGGNIGPGPGSPANFIGDYIGIDASTVSQPVWMDSRDANQDTYAATASGC